MADVSVLDVLLHDEPIGTLTRVGGDRSLFAFNDAYIEDENRPVLGLGFKDQFGELITEFRPTHTRGYALLLEPAARRASAHLPGGARRRKSGARILPALGTWT